MLVMLTGIETRAVGEYGYGRCRCRCRTIQFSPWPTHTCHHGLWDQGMRASSSCQAFGTIQSIIDLQYLQGNFFPKHRLHPPFSMPPESESGARAGLVLGKFSLVWFEPFLAKLETKWFSLSQDLPKPNLNRLKPI